MSKNYKCQHYKTKSWPNTPPPPGFIELFADDTNDDRLSIAHSDGRVEVLEKVINDESTEVDELWSAKKISTVIGDIKTTLDILSKEVAAISEKIR